MIIKKRCFILLVFLQFSLLLAAIGPDDYTLFNQSVFRFRYNPSDARALNNFFIREIANYNYLELYKTGYNLGFEHSLNIREPSKGNFEIGSSMVLKGMDGDIFYEGFNISQVLMPSTYSFDLSVFDKDLRLIKVLNFKDLFIGKLDDEPVNLIELPIQSGSVFKITNLTFSYLETDKTGFIERIVEVNRFLGFLSLSANMLIKAGSINPDEPEIILSNFIKIYDLERFSKISASLTFSSDLDIPEKDSLAFSENLFSHSVNQRRLQTIFDQNVDTLKKEIGNAEIQAAAEKIINLQLGYLTSLEMSKYLFEPVYLQMSRMFGNQNSWISLLDAITAYFSGRPQISFLPDFGNTFGRILYQKYLAKADWLIEQQKYNEAVLLIESAGVVCQNQIEKDCDLAVFNRLSKAKYGIYDAYLKIAGQALTKKSPDLAKKYLDIAQVFQENNRSMILSKELINQNMRILAEEYCDLGRKALKSGFAIEALNDLSSALAIYQRLHETNFDDQIKNDLEIAFDLKFEEMLERSQKYLEAGNLDKADEEVAQIQALATTYPEIRFDQSKFEVFKETISKNRFEIRYNNLKNALRYENFDEAVVQLKSLRETHPQSFHQSEDEITGYIKLYLKPALLQKIGLANERFLADNQKDTDSIIAEILTLKNNFPGFNDSEVENAFAGLMKSFETDECGTLKSSITRRTDETIQLLGAKMYHEADLILSQLLLEIQSGKGCLVNDSILKSLQANYNDVFVYYRLLIQTEEKYSKNDFQGAIEIHLKAENCFYQKNIYRFDETYRSIEEFITAKSNPGLNSTAIGYYSRKQDYRKMISLFHLFLQNGFDIGKYDSYLSEAGTAMALADKARFPQSDPIFMLEKLSLGKQDFQPFKSAYIKAWKNKKDL